MKRLMIGIMIALCAMGVTAGTLEAYEYYVSDKVSGRNLELVEFEDDLFLIDTLMYNDMMKTNSNIFKGEFAMGYPFEGDTEFFSEGASFSGKTTFDGGSYVKYSIQDFELEETNMDEFGLTEVFGTAMFEYEEKVIVKKQIPVSVYFNFYGEGDEYEQEIVIEGTGDEDLNVVFMNNEEKRNTFRQKRKCFGLCDNE